MAPKSESLNVHPNEFYETRERSVVCIKDNDRLQGGGVFVQVGSRRLILTAAHVVHNKKKLRVHCCDNKSFPVDIDYISRVNDLAWLEVLRGDVSDYQCLELTELEIPKGSYVYFIGHPRMARYSYAIGEIVSSSRTCLNIYSADLGFTEEPIFNRNPDPCFIDDFLGLSSKIQLVQVKNVHGGGRFGGTGAPFLDSNGRILGIYSFTWRESDYAIHSRVIKQVQDVVESKYQKRMIESAQASTSGTCCHTASWYNYVQIKRSKKRL